MFTSRVARILVLGAVVASLAGLSATRASAAVPNSTFTMAPGWCYLPENVAYGGVSPSIGTPAFQFNNGSGRTVTVREWVIVVDYLTGAQVRYRWEGDRTLAPGASTTYPGASMDLSFRTADNYFWAAARVELDVYANGSLFMTATGVPSSYRIWKNSPFYTYLDTGRNQSSC